MMTSISRVDLGTPDFPMSTRPCGDSALRAVLSNLEETDVVELNFQQKSPTPSFADQCVGGLAKQLGMQEFRRRIKILNLPADSAPLMRHVIMKGVAD